MTSAVPVKPRCLVAMACLSLVIGCGHSQRADVAIRGVTVVNVIDGSLVTDRTVLVRGNRIVAVGPVAEITVPSNADVLEAQGRYVIPGLWDMHVHSVANVAVDK